jgi:hypothetical protein
MEDKPAPIACDLHKLTAAEREREKSLLDEVRKAALEIRDVPSGYALQFPGDASTVLTLAEFITLERACCPFLNFELRCEAEGGAVPNQHFLRSAGARHHKGNCFGLGLADRTSGLGTTRRAIRRPIIITC